MIWWNWGFSVKEIQKILILENKSLLKGNILEDRLVAPLLLAIRKEFRQEFTRNSVALKLWFQFDMKIHGFYFVQAGVSASFLIWLQQGISSLRDIKRLDQTQQQNIYQPWLHDVPIVVCWKQNYVVLLHASCFALSKVPKFAVLGVLWVYGRVSAEIICAESLSGCLPSGTIRYLEVLSAPVSSTGLHLDVNIFPRKSVRWIIAVLWKDLSSFVQFASRGSKTLP